MTVQDEKQVNPQPVTQEVAVPPIESEVDVPFAGTANSPQGINQANLSKTESLDDQITRFKYLTGKTVLFISMAAMGLSVVVSIILSCFGIQNSLLENAFEVFKLIAMTVLGYIFGSKTK